MLSYRPADLEAEADRDFILEMHCLASFESDSPWARSVGLAHYRQKWHSTPQPQSFLETLQASRADGRTLVDIWEEADARVGYLWVTFLEIEGYGLTVAEVNELAVTSTAQRRGIGTKMLQRAEAHARERGADILRSDTGIENVPSQKLHEKVGFDAYHLQYEKRLTDL